MNEEKDKIQINFSDDEILSLIEKCRFGGTYKKWKQTRRFIVQAINKEGSFLDIGCANGFLLKCLQAWQPNPLNIYGIDNREQAILEARKLHSSIPDHFQIISGSDLFRVYEKVYEEKIPNQYDYVYRNYWKGEDMEDPERLKLLIETLLKIVKPGGRLILGIYAGVKQIEEHPNMTRWITNMKKAAGKIDGEAVAEIGTCQWIMWMDV